MSAFLPVLAYQKIGRAPQHSRLKNEWVSTRRLAKQITWLLKHHYTFITPADLPKTQPPKTVMLVFIGGYQSFYTDVFPLLKTHQICATLLLAVDTVGTYNRWQNPHQEPWQNIVTPKQLKEMQKSKRVQIGTLGLDGRNLLTETPAAARQILLESVFRLEKLHKITPCAVAFWPFIKDPQHRAQAIGSQLSLPVITSQTGKNPLTEKKFLRILRPGLFTKFLLWKNTVNR